MRLTIVPDDNKVKIDGIVAFNVSMDGVNPLIHAVQWYGSHGEIEWKPSDTEPQRNETIDSIDAFAFLVTRHAEVIETAKRLAEKENN